MFLHQAILTCKQQIGLQKNVQRFTENVQSRTLSLRGHVFLRIATSEMTLKFCPLIYSHFTKLEVTPNKQNTFCRTS